MTQDLPTMILLLTTMILLLTSGAGISVFVPLQQCNLTPTKITEYIFLTFIRLIDSSQYSAQENCHLNCTRR